VLRDNTITTYLVREDCEAESSQDGLHVSQAEQKKLMLQTVKMGPADTRLVKPREVRGDQVVET
jgi:hypothetical protein